MDMDRPGRLCAVDIGFLTFFSQPARPAGAEPTLSEIIPRKLSSKGRKSAEILRTALSDGDGYHGSESEFNRSKREKLSDWYLREQSQTELSRGMEIDKRIHCVSLSI